MRPPLGLLRLLLTLASFLVAVTVAEVFLRLAHPVDQSTYRIDEELVLGIEPGSRKLFVRSPENGGDRVMVRFNRDGYRGDELLPRGSAHRVAVYGDSFVEAEFSPQERTFVSRLGAALAARTGSPVEAVNAGVIGYGPDQEVLRMEREADSLAPDLVVLVLCSNDFGDLVRNPLFRLGPEGRLEPNEFAISPQLRAGLEPPRGLSRLHVVRGARLLGQDLLVRFRRVAGQRAGEGPHARVPTYVEDSLETLDLEFRVFIRERQSHSVLDDCYDADVALTPEAESSRYKVRMLEAVLDRAKGFLARRDVPLVLVLVPAALDACDRYFLEVDQAKHPGYQRSRLTDVKERIAEKLGIPTVDLFSPFRASDPCGLFFGLDDDHWNDRGQELAANVVADLIAQRGLLRSRAVIPGR